MHTKVEIYTIFYDPIIPGSNDLNLQVASEDLREVGEAAVSRDAAATASSLATVTASTYMYNNINRKE